jgi:hypothetical protein
MVHLNEAYSKISRFTGGITPADIGQFRRAFLTNGKNWDLYTSSLLAGLNERDAKDIKTISENTRMALLENSVASLNQYETLTVPVLRKFYPRLIAKELVHVSPIDKPEVIKAFVKAYFGTANDVESGVYPYMFPYIAASDRITAYVPGDTAASNLTEISRGPSVGIGLDGDAAVGAATNILTELSLTSSDAHIDRDFVVTSVDGVIDGTSVSTDLKPFVKADIDGNFSFDATLKLGNTVKTDTVLGRINYFTGELDVQSLKGDIKSIHFVATASLEENQINSKVKYDVEKVKLSAITRQISAEWTIPFEQDLKALYDLDLQTELVNIIGEQIAIEIDRQIIDELIQGCVINNSASHIDSWSVTPDATYAWGQKQWMETILPKINKLSAVVYNDTQMGQANIIAANPIDAAVFESLNNFNYTGSSSEGGDLGYSSMSIAGGKYKVVVSTIVPQGKMILIYKAPQEERAVYFYAPYQMPLLTPYPLQAKPAMTIMVRYAVKLVRPEGISILKVTA